MSAPDKALIDQLYREDVERARVMSPEEKLSAGGELFDEVCERMRFGIRRQYPDVSEERVAQILCERLETAKRLENGRDE